MVLVGIPVYKGDLHYSGKLAGEYSMVSATRNPGSTQPPDHPQFIEDLHSVLPITGLG